MNLRYCGGEGVPFLRHTERTYKMVEIFSGQAEISKACAALVGAWTSNFIGCRKMPMT